MRVEFHEDSLPGKIISEFLREDVFKNSATRAELRRCDAEAEVMLTPAYHRILRRFRPLELDDYEWETRLAIVIGLVSHLKDEREVFEATDKGKRSIEIFVRRIAGPNGEPPIVSELRFRRLLQRSRKDLYPAMIRLIRHLKGQANVYGLAQSVYHWDDSVKRRWAFEYFSNAESKEGTST